VWLVWLFVALTIAWRWRIREPALAGLGALSCAVVLLLVMALLVSWRSFDTTGGYYRTLVQLAMVMGLGLQLPPAWRLAARTRPRLAGPIAAGVMTAAAFVAVLALFLGSDPIFSLGPQVHIWADFALAAALSILGVSRWWAGEDQTLMAVLTAAALFNTAAALFNVWVVGFSMLFPGSLAEIFVLRFLLLGLAWFTIGIAWLRQSAAAPANPEATHV
jgi:hypothetical protein